jgi:hypothetical protein
LNIERKLYWGLHYAAKIRIVKVEFSHYSTSSTILDLSFGPMMAHQLFRKNRGTWMLTLAVPLQLESDFMSLNGEDQIFFGFTYQIKAGLDFTYEFARKYRLTMGLELEYHPRFRSTSRNFYYLWQGRSYTEAPQAILLSAVVGFTSFY